jgi:hypothetical protein
VGGGWRQRIRSDAEFGAGAARLNVFGYSSLDISILTGGRMWQRYRGENTVRVEVSFAATRRVALSP